MTETMDVEHAPRAGRREWIGLAVLALACLLYSMDLTVLHLAVPALSADLRPTSTQLLWIIDIYGFMVAGSLLTMGTLGDRIGRRKLLLIGAAASVPCRCWPPSRSVPKCSSGAGPSWVSPGRHWPRGRCRSSSPCFVTMPSGPSP